MARAGGIRLNSRTVLVTLAAVALVAIPPVVSTSGAPSFAAPVILPNSSGFGEPSIAVAPDGTIYVAAPGSHTSTWRSTNGAASFSRVADTPGASGDSDLAIDANGVVYASDLFNNVPVSASFDKASTYAYMTTSGISGSIDRQWLAAHGDGNVWSIWRDGSTERVATSHDHATTWTRNVAATGVAYQGNLVATSDNDVYIPYTSGASAWVSISHDGGASWTNHQASATANGTFLFPAVAVDAAGRIYEAWAEGGPSQTANAGHAPRIAVVSSADDGVTWTPRTVVSTAGEYNIFPWLAADAAGHVALAWFEGVPLGGVGSDSNTAALTSWYVSVALSVDAGASWSVTRATGVFHIGPICTFGTLCFPASNPLVLSRQLLDFFEIGERSNGDLVIAYSGDQSPGNPGSRATYLYVVSQNGGANLKS